MDFTFADWPLEDPCNDIRLLGLLPGRLEHSIACTVATRSLTPAHDQNLAYEVLSYAWDQEQPTDSIKLHIYGHDQAMRMYITPNLSAALRHLRGSTSLRFLWIDTICIDHSDSQEKNRQVALMTKIYRRTEHVCVWLGQSSDDSDKALQFIGNAGHLIATSAWKQDEPDWRAFYYFISRPWFRQRWAIQAIALARRATLFCDDRTIGWHELANALSIVQEIMTDSRNDEAKHDYFSWFGPMALQPAFRLAEMRNDVRGVSRDEDDIGRPWSLETLMWKFHDFKTSDPRDAIYALLALAKDRTLIEPSLHSLTYLPIDYYKLYLDVCKDYIRSTVEVSGSLDVLCRPGKPFDERIGWKSLATPSWLPQNSSITIAHRTDGEYVRLNADVLVGPPGPGKKYYNASGSIVVTNASSSIAVSDASNSVADTNAFRFGTGIKNSSLFVEGLVVDAIAEKQPAALRGDERNYVSDGVPDQWRAAGGWMDSAKEPPDAYWRTLVANRGPNGSGTPDFYPIACGDQAKNRYSRVAKNYNWDREQHTTPMSRATDALVVKFVLRVQEVVVNRRLINTVSGRLGLAPKMARKRDLVCILFGCSVPVLLGQQTDAGTGEEYFLLIGECYIHGIMEGEALELARRQSGNDTISKREFEIR